MVFSQIGFANSRLIKSSLSLDIPAKQIQQIDENVASFIRLNESFKSLGGSIMRFLLEALPD